MDEAKEVVVKEEDLLKYGVTLKQWVDSAFTLKDWRDGKIKVPEFKRSSEKEIARSLEHSRKYKSNINYRK